eukprot:jgi/Mesen1/3850/ME000207S02868
MTEPSPTAPPRAYKARGRVSDQQKRRDIALARQQGARRDLQAHARRLALDASCEDLPPAGAGERYGLSPIQVDALSSSDPFAQESSGSWPAGDANGHALAEEDTLSRERREEHGGERGLLEGGNLWGQKAREWYAQQLMLPEWMLDVPPRLPQDWYVMARPEGKRCLVITSNGTTVSRLRNGRILHRFPSALPNGAKTRQVAAAAHFRLFWVHSKLAETGALELPSHFHKFQHAHYALGITPLALLWKDAHCSPYVIDTDKDGNVPPQQQVVLQYSAHDGDVRTGDEPPVALARLPASFLQANEQHLQEGLLLSFAIGDGGLLFEDGRPVAADLHYRGPANQRRGGSDTLSKILFQYAARHNPLTFAELEAAALASTHDNIAAAMGALDGSTAMSDRNAVAA